MRDDEGRTEKGQQVLQAKEVYVLMNDDYTISRNARSSWYLRNLNTVLPCKQKEQLNKSDDFEIISVIPTDDLASRERSTNCYFCLAPSTIITFLAHRYRFVFVLDTSPSLASLDAASSGVLYDRVFLCLRNTLKSLVKQFCTPGSAIQLRPQLYISIIVHTTSLSCRMKQVLLHGCQVTQDNVDEVLSKVQKDLIQLENSIASSIAHIISDRTEDENDLQRTSESSQIDFSIRTELLELQSEDRIILSADVNFVLMLRYGLLALQLLPENCTSGIIVITDGVVGFPDSSVFEMLMQQMRHDMVACSFVQVGCGYEMSRSFGHVPYPELMQFMATATFGTYFSAMPRLTETGDPAMNSVHRGLLTRSFQRPLDSHTLRSLFSSTLENEFFHDPLTRELSPELSCGHLWSTPSVQRKYSESNLHAPLTVVIACRLRDGYSIRNVSLNKNMKGESQIEIRLVLPWRDRVTVLYIAKSIWPLTMARCTTHVEVITEATQDFFQESAAFLSQPKSPSLRRLASVKYWEALQQMSQTDLRMVHFQSFNTNPAYYTIPDPLRHSSALRDSIPLFFHPSQMSTEPQLNRQLNQRDPNIMEFAKFWKPILTIDVTIWHKWMHVHRIGLILEHDVPVGKHLHSPNSSGRYSSVYCRQAFDMVMDYLHGSTSFVLMEKHSYIRLLFGQSDKVPTSFYLVRVESKSPYLILRIAFLSGMSGKRRTQILNEIKSAIASLKFQLHGVPKQNGGKKVSSKADAESKRMALDRHWTEVFSCCVVTKKPLEKILIKYEKVPTDFNAMELIPSNERSAQMMSASASRLALHSQTTLSNYLSHHRWIWSLQRGTVQIFSLQSVGKILSMLAQLGIDTTRVRTVVGSSHDSLRFELSHRGETIRLQEGFRFASSNSGILNMALEVDMQPSANKRTKELCTCVVQYIIFPPHNTLRNGSVHESLLRTSVMSNCSEETLDDIDGIEPEGSGLEIVTECWVEPQDGTAVTKSQRLKHFNNLDYKQLLESMFPFDIESISVLVTFEYLCLVCQNAQISLPPLAGGSSLTVTEMSNRGCQSTSPSLHLDHSIDHITFPFDLFVLFAKSQQTELLFSTYKHSESANELKPDFQADVSQSSSHLFSLFLDQLQALHDRELPLSEDDCLQFVRAVINRKRDESLQPLPFTKKAIYSEENREPPSFVGQPVNQSQLKPEEPMVHGVVTPPIAKWRCFVRMEDSGHLIFSVVPASYTDLNLLNASSTEARSTSEAEPGDHDDMGSEQKVEEFSSVDPSAQNRGQGQETDEIQSIADTELMHSEVQSSVLPVYIYNCPLGIVTEQLLNRWTYERPGDIYEDFTFEDDIHNLSFTSTRSSEFLEKAVSPRITDRLPFPGLDQKRASENEGFGGRDRWRRSATEHDIYKDHEALGRHRTLVSDVFLRCFVIGVYESLRMGRWVDSRDVDAAINRVCEESVLVEINVSKFLQSSCQTMRDILDAWTREDSSRSLKDKATEDPTRSERSWQRNPLLGLLETHLCESSSGLHDLLRSKFSRVLNPHFKPIPTCSEFFYYSAPSDHHRTGESLALDDDVLTCATAGLTDTEGDLDPDVVKGAQRTAARASSNISSSDSVCDETSKFDRMRQCSGSTPPLFIHLNCSIHLPSGLQGMPVQSLPMCLSELGDCLSELALVDCDISDLKVTLDFICLTLPPPDDLKDSSTRPSYSRTVSNMSQVSNATDEETEGGSPDVRMTSNPVDLIGVKDLPKCQQLSVTACKEEILWLLEDEIISSLRLNVPVIEKTLCNVVSHVKSSPGRVMCLSTDIPLQFVFSSEMSMRHFVEQFEKLRIQKYRLAKEGSFFYLCKDQICNNVIEGASALSSALKNLGISSPVAVDVMTSDSANKVDTDAGAELTDTMIHDQEVSDSVENLVKDDEPKPETEDSRVDESKDSLTSSKDIQILVSRPSPIREIAVTKMETLDVVEVADKEKETEINVSKQSSESFALGKQSSVDSLPPSSKEEVAALEASSTKLEMLEVSAVKEGSRDVLDTQEPSHDKNQPTDSVSVPDNASLSFENCRDVTEATAPDSAGIIPSASFIPEDSEMIPSEARTRRVRPISGPAIFNVVRKNQSLTDSFDVTKFPFHSFSQQNISRESPSSMKPLTEYTMVSSSHSIKRVQSSLSFEKLRPERQKLRYPSQGTSSLDSSTPQVDGRAQLRSRHASGLETPISAVDTSSLASTGEAGYEGDSSDPDEDGAMMSYNESISTVRRCLPIPDFWQILRLNSDKVEAYFHARDTFDSKSARRYKELFRVVTESIRQLCHSVNQKLLLSDMYSKSCCNELLVPEADEDIKWSRDVLSQEKSQRYRYVKDPSSDSDNEVSHDSRCLAANMQFVPGHFACTCVYQAQFVLHPRLKLAPQRGKESTGVQALMSVLDKFVVVNRKNMYIFKESVGDNVFYMRLSESTQEIKAAPVHQPSIDSDDYKLPASQDLSSLSFALSSSTKQDGDDSRSSSAAGMSDRDGEHQLNLSQSFRGASNVSRHRTEERVTLFVYGIAPVGSDISQNLVQVLQKKLDEATLEVVTLTLSRNAMCKLLPEDVQFIQKPNSLPVKKLQFVIPSSAILHQFALAYYLRQNLLQFLFTPKYADGGKPENTFQDYENSPSTPIPESDVFLYIRPQQSGGKGIACIHLSFVDSKGATIQLLGSPKLSPQAYREPLDRSMFDGMVNTYQYRPAVSPTKSPGPMSLIQFRIWECGTLDMAQLTDKLLQATKQAICDIILEYRLLTAPICEVPQHYGKGMDSPMHSAPASPGLCTINAESRHSQDSSVRRTGMDIGRAVIKTPKETSSSIQTLLFDIFQSKPSVVEGIPMMEQMRNIVFAASESLDESKQVANERVNHELMKKIQRYESGEKGNLTSAFVTCIPDWFEHCCKLEVPAVSKYQYQLSSRFPIDYFLKEASNIVNNICQDMTAAIFRSHESFMSSDASLDFNFTPYQPMRMPNKDGGRNPVTLDFVKSTIGGFPGRSYSYVMIGRNVAEWRAVIDSLQDDNGHIISYSQPGKVHRKCQKFPPLECDSEGKSSQSSSYLPSTSSSSLDQMERISVPRQQLLLLLLMDKQMTIYLYNWASDLASTVERQLMRQVQWHNARSHLLTCLVTQKMGLFQHSLFGDLPSDLQESNPFLLTVSDVDHLVKLTAVPQSHLQKIRNRSGSVASSRIAHLAPLVPLGPQFDELYRDFQPPCPMHKTTYGGLRDPLHRHGAQALELRSLERKENEKCKKLEELYKSWQQRSSSTPAVSEDLLNLLKQSSRVIHYVSTPLLFSPLWLRQSFTKTEMVAPARRESMKDAKLQPSHRSRHNSGASTRSKRSDSIESTQKFTSCTSLEGLNWQPSSCLWYVNLCQSFLSQYTQYLMTMSFTVINYQPSPISADPDRSNSKDGSKCQGNCTYLQKSLPGGVMLIELAFRDVYFCVTVYAFECSSVPVGKNVNPQLTVIFTDECDKFKDLTHLHSFSHDYHVRLVQSFISTDHGLFPASYMTSLLQEIRSYFPDEPSFSWNYIHEAKLSIPSGATSGQLLFDYMLHYDGLLLMDTIVMTPIQPEDDPCHAKEFRSALICNLPSVLQPNLIKETSQQSIPANGSNGDFDISVVIALNPSPSDMDGSILNLRYWIVVTNRQQLFPKQNLEKKLALFNAVQTKVTVSTQPAVCHIIGPRGSSAATELERLPQESINYRGYSNVHQMAVQALIMATAEVVQVKITEMLKRMKNLCRRDFLWRCLQMAEPVEDESRRRRKTGADDDLREPHLSKMPFSDFRDLLSLTTKIDVSEVDPKINPIFDLPSPAYNSLIRVLVTKYPETSRYLSSYPSGGPTQYVVIFNPQCLDVFMMLTINDLTQSTNMCVVYRDPILTNKDLPGFRKHFESVVSTCCYHLWTNLVL